MRSISERRAMAVAAEKANTLAWLAALELWMNAECAVERARYAADIDSRVRAGVAIRGVIARLSA